MSTPNKVPCPIRIITSEEHVPRGYTPLTNYKGEFRQRVDLWLKQRRINAVKLMKSIDDRGGPVWVDSFDVAALDSDYQSQQNAKAFTDEAKPTPPPTEMQEVLKLLRELTVRVDYIGKRMIAEYEEKFNSNRSAT